MFQKFLRLTIFLIVCLLLITSYSLLPSPVAAQESWVITNFTTELTLGRDTNLDVTETIAVDFGALPKHGIYRTIPVRYQTSTGNTLDIRFRLASVTDANNQNIPYDLSKSGDYLTVKIGDPDRTISGPQTYIINYQVNRVLTRPGAEAELTWNTTGHAWPVPILKATTNLHAPDASLTRTICFTGYPGSKSQNCTHGHDGTIAVYTATGLDPGTGLTIAAALNPDFFTFPGRLQEITWFLRDNWPFLLPLLTLTIMLYLYWQKGRDRAYTGLFTDSTAPLPLFARPIMRQTYGPPKHLTPGQVGTLADERVNHADITATIIDLARRGFVSVKEDKPKGLIFKKPQFTLYYHDQPGQTLADYESALLDMLFTTSREPKVDLDDLPKDSYKHLETAQKALYQDLTDNGYFLGNPNTVRRVYLVAGILIAGGGIALIAPALATITSNASSFVGVVGSGLIISAFSPFMPARTAKGRRALEEVLGLREWIRLGAWREQIHEKHNFFEEVLPYTIAFGLTGKFLEAFKDAKLKAPSWYQGSSTFNPVYFQSSLPPFNNSLTPGIASTRPQSSSGSSFGGGGSSGGGFGGGGGGSW